MRTETVHEAKTLIAETERANKPTKYEIDSEWPSFQVRVFDELGTTKQTSIGMLMNARQCPFQYSKTPNDHPLDLPSWSSLRLEEIVEVGHIEVLIWPARFPEC